METHDDDVHAALQKENSRVFRRVKIFGFVLFLLCSSPAREIPLSSLQKGESTWARQPVKVDQIGSKCKTLFNDIYRIKIDSASPTEKTDLVSKVLNSCTVYNVTK